MSTTSQVAALAQRVAAEFKTIRSTYVPNAQVGSIALPGTPSLGQVVQAVANSATALPSDVVWDTGGAPIVAGRRVLSFTWDGYSWLGTYTPEFAPASGYGTLAAAINALSPVGYWKLDETSGTTAFDSSGNGHHGTYTGTVTLNDRDGAPSFASGGNVIIPDHDDFTVGAQGITLFGIGYITADSGTNSLYVMKGAPDNYEWGLGVSWPDNGRTSQASWWTLAGADFQGERTTTPHVKNQWVALAAAFGVPSTVGARFPLYVNSGSPPATIQPAAMSDAAKGNSTAPVTIARGSFEGVYTGAVRHVAVFDKMLTAGEIGALMDHARAEGLIP